MPRRGVQPATGEAVTGSSAPKQVQDSPAQSGQQPLAPAAVTNFQGINENGYIPADSAIGAGPDHVVEAANIRWQILTKTGTKQADVNATTWFKNVLPALGTVSLGDVFDPQVVYDQHSSRWVMSWLAEDDISAQGWLLISVSDDADPNGNWCNFAASTTVNGSTSSGNWGDFDGLGVDSQAVYVTTNQFSFADGLFDYAKVRIFKKSQLYNTSCPAFGWYDFWDLRDPGSPSVQVDTVRPALTFGTPGVEYLVNKSPFLTNNHVTLWSLTNPLSATPTLTAQNVTVATTAGPPDAGQPNGVDKLATGYGTLENAVFQNGSVWTTHTISDSTGLLSLARYLRISVAGPTVLEDQTLGASNCWYFYPAVTVDGSDNMVMVFNRSCTTSFAEVRYTGKKTTDALIEVPSAQLKAGATNFLSHRWGDYSGIAVDAADTTKVWIAGEYATSPQDTWGTCIG